MLNHNEITEMILPKAIPENLRVLDLSNNRIRELPTRLPELLSKNFEMLDVSYNQLHKLSNSFHDLFQTYQLDILVEDPEQEYGRHYYHHSNNPNWKGSYLFVCVFFLFVIPILGTMEKSLKMVK